MINRLYPAKNSGRFHVLTQLRLVLEKIISEDLQHLKNARLLDFGCGDKPYLPIWKNKVNEYIGVDFSDNKKADLHFDKNGNLPEHEKQFNIVFSSQVLEHVKNVDKYLNSAAKALDNDGTIVLSTHGFWQYHPHPTDYWRWTKDGLIEEFNRNGKFEVLKAYSIMDLTTSGLQLFQDGISHKVPSVFRKLFFRLIKILQGYFDSYNKSSNNAAVYVIVAKKKK